MFLKKGGISRRGDERRKGGWYAFPHYAYMNRAVIISIGNDVLVSSVCKSPSLTGHEVKPNDL